MVNEMKCLNDVNYKDCVGKVCKSKSSGDFKIVKYNDAKDVEIQFLKTGFETSATLGNIRNGEVKDLYSSSVHGVGVLGTKYSISEYGRDTKEYVLWSNMLMRCYSDTYQKKQPTYKDCEVSENFKSYEYFYEWCSEQIGFGNEGWQLDKDLLVKGNKVYNEYSCVFIPKEVNILLTKRGSMRGEHLIGVYYHERDKAFVAQVSKNKGKREYLGCFKTEIEAFNVYKQAKESFIRGIANKWKGQIDPRAYEALINYEVDIND